MPLRAILSDSQLKTRCQQQIAQKLLAIQNRVSGVQVQDDVLMNWLSQTHSELALLYSILATFYPNVTGQDDSPAEG